MGRIVKNGVEYGRGGADILNLIYPVGIIVDFGTEGKDFNPNMTWAPQKWQKMEDGRVTIGANSTYPIGSTGGVEKHYLVAAIGATDNDSSRIGYIGTNISPFQQNRTYQYTVLGKEASSIGVPNKKFNHGVNVTDGKADESDDGYTSNMQPYTAVNRWKRIS